MPNFQLRFFKLRHLLLLLLGTCASTAFAQDESLAQPTIDLNEIIETFEALELNQGFSEEYLHEIAQNIFLDEEFFVEFGSSAQSPIEGQMAALFYTSDGVNISLASNNFTEDTSFTFSSSSATTLISADQIHFSIQNFPNSLAFLFNGNRFELLGSEINSRFDNLTCDFQLDTSGDLAVFDDQTHTEEHFRICNYTLSTDTNASKDCSTPNLDHSGSISISISSRDIQTETATPELNTQCATIISNNTDIFSIDLTVPPMSGTEITPPSSQEELVVAEETNNSDTSTLESADLVEESSTGANSSGGGSFSLFWLAIFTLLFTRRFADK